MTLGKLEALIEELTAPLAQLRENQRETRRGAGRRRAAGAGPKDKLSPSDRILATILYQRRLCTQAVLAALFGVNKGTIGTAVHQTSPLLDEHGYTITPSTARFPAPADLVAFLADASPSIEINSVCEFSVSPYREAQAEKSYGHRLVCTCPSGKVDHVETDPVAAQVIHEMAARLLADDTGMITTCTEAAPDPGRVFSPADHRACRCRRSLLQRSRAVAVGRPSFRSARCRADAPRSLAPL
jgi:hypothetical protein